MIISTFKSLFSTTIKYVPLALGLGIISVGVIFVPWKDVVPYIHHMSPLTIISLVGLGFAYYFSRIVRYKYILGTLGQSLSIGRITIAYFVAQPISLLPGGELYRSIMLKKHGNVPLRDGVPSVFMQSLTENIGLVAVALVGAIVLHKYVALVVIVALVYFAVVALIHRQNIRKSHRLINKLPLVNISHYRVNTLVKKLREVLSGSSFVILIVTSFISTFVAVLALYLTAQSFGVEIDFVQAAIAFTLPMILQFVTFLPGGLGVNEQGSVGILLLLGVALAPAVAITLVIRFITLVFGLILGCMAILYTKVNKHEKS